MKTVLITGADKGLGYSFVKHYLTKGHRVIAGQYLEESEGLNMLKDLYSEKLLVVQMDVSSDESIRQATDLVKDEVDAIDILINNAGILGDIERTVMDTLDFDEILGVINVNALGPLRVMNGMINLVLASEDKIIANISSEAGSIADNDRDAWFGYTMSKAAANMCGSVVQQGIREMGGRVLQIHPGYLQSYMHGSLNTDGAYTTDEAAEMIAQVIANAGARPLEDFPLYLNNQGQAMNW